MTPTGIVEFHAKRDGRLVSVQAFRIAMFHSKSKDEGTIIVIEKGVLFTVTESYEEVSAAIISAL